MLYLFVFIYFKLYYIYLIILSIIWRMLDRLAIQLWLVIVDYC